MSDSRREFIKKATLLTGAAGLFSALPSSIQKAMAINAAPGSTYMDAEYVVFLMQENRSFDHCFGTLKGVRGFNDPRALQLVNKNPVWLQSNTQGKTYAPFRLNLKDTSATWMSSLPHSWENQVDARNGGKHDKWLDSKRSGNKDFANMPLTLGYYNREDLPFYYALADAFTVCDQHFSSSLTGTSPNRLFFWSGTVREAQNENSKAHVWNDEIDYKDLQWTTFPEHLEDMGISWKVYQNELSIPVGFEGEEEDWLSNFTDNDLEFFRQYNVRFHSKHIKFMEKHSIALQEEINSLRNKTDEIFLKRLEIRKKQLHKVREDQKVWNREGFEKLTEREKNIHRKAFVTNENDPDYHEMVSMTYDDDGVKREMRMPKGDVLHQFRTDVEKGELPAVSWLVPPAHFSDHPGSPWYGAWYISEVMDILTKKPEVFKKTIFIITYDENDGYFDHVPPFLPPNTSKPETGKTSAGIDTCLEHVSMQEELARGMKEKRESAIGLGYRVPMLVISPWTKGGWVNSQVFDHTSNLQFLEHFFSAKLGKKIGQAQISSWRRTITGDLTSVFRAAEGGRDEYPQAVQKDKFMQQIFNAKFKDLPEGFNKGLTLPQQEKGISPSSALPYQLYVNGKFDAVTNAFSLDFESKNQIFGERTAGAPFIVYFPGKTEQKDHTGKLVWDNLHSRYYAVKAGDLINDKLPLSIFENQRYHMQVYGPNGFFREFKGDAKDPIVQIICECQRDRLNINHLSGNLELKLVNLDKNRNHEIAIIDHAYQAKPKSIFLKEEEKSVVLDLQSSYGWYDFSILIKNSERFEQRFAGRVETGRPSFSDPFMGKV